MCHGHTGGGEAWSVHAVCRNIPTTATADAKIGFHDGERQKKLNQNRDSDFSSNSLKIKGVCSQKHHV